MEKKKWVKHIPLFVIEILVLIAAIGVLSVVLRATGENGVKKDIIDEEQIAVNPEVKEKVTESKEPEAANVYTGIYNVAFFGVDARDENLGKGNNRSDTIMICSIDMDEHEVRLISVYRDTYLNIDYVTVGFDGLMEAVDALGGIEMEITEAEISHLNNYQISMVGTTEDGKNFVASEGVDYTPVTEPGLQTLNGLQATAYCRIRYIGDDFQRTERQRNVLIAMMEKAKKSSLSTLMDAANAVLPHVITSIDVSDMLSMLGMIGDFKVTVSDGFPFRNMLNGGPIRTEGECIVPTSLEDNAVKLHELLFPEEEYEPSAELKSYSDIIEKETEGYLKY